ncbi:MAG: hypothetical protein L0H53_11155, partial [Candidatus Nitrosocosmicus sp.]|nr:hypothetical protein [Candidatus Nitrosocosmicus sp.]
KSMIENAYLQQKQMIETNYTQFKSMIENAYLQQKQMIETNASMMKNYSSMFGNSGIVSNIEKAELHFLTLNEESKKSMINQLDLIKDNFLSNAIRIKEEYNNIPNTDKFIPNFDGSAGPK